MEHIWTASNLFWILQHTNKYFANKYFIMQNDVQETKVSSGESNKILFLLKKEK